MMIYKNDLIWLLSALDFTKEKEFYHHIQKLTKAEVIATDGVVAHIVHTAADGYVAGPSEHQEKAAETIKKLLNIKPESRILLDADLLIQALEGFKQNRIYLEVCNEPDKEEGEEKFLVIRSVDKIAIIKAMHEVYAAFSELRIEQE